jgi:hypothetical protein
MRRDARFASCSDCSEKALEAEILKEATENAWDRKWIARSPLLRGDDDKLVCDVLGLARSNVQVRVRRPADWVIGAVIDGPTTTASW